MRLKAIWYRTLSTEYTQRCGYEKQELVVQHDNPRSLHLAIVMNYISIISKHYDSTSVVHLSYPLKIFQRYLVN